MTRLLLVLTAVFLSHAFCTAAERPNIIFILADDWGTGDVNAYGGDRCKIDTPNMDRLAEQGMKFTDAHSSSAVCTPTRYGVLTGRYNWRSRLKKSVLYGFSDALIEENRETVASFLKKNGYDTAMFGKWHLGLDLPTTDGKPAACTAKKPEELTTKCNVDWTGTIGSGPTSIGFDKFWGISASLDMPPYIWIEDDHFVGECTTIKAFHRPGPAEPDFEDYDVLPTLAAKASAYVREQAKTDEPFFLYMPLNSPHTPISPSKAWQGKSSLGPYGDFVMETDWAIGEVVNAVDESKISNNTLIIVTADNGCSPASKRGDPHDMIRFRMGEPSTAADDPTKHYASNIYRGHKADIYDGGHRVPYIARWTGTVKAGSVCDQTVCLVDLFGTCAGVLGKTVADNVAEDSYSLLPALLQTSDKPIREATVHHSINGSFAIRRGKWKLSLCPGSGGWSNPRPGRASKDLPPVQLYDMESDVAETTNLAAAHPDIVDELKSLLQGYVDKGRSTPGATQENNGAVHIVPQSNGKKPTRKKQAGNQ